MSDDLTELPFGKDPRRVLSGRRGGQIGAARRWANHDRGPASKPCEHCGETFHRGPREFPYTFRHRRFCSIRCGSMARSRRTTAERLAITKPCAACGTVFPCKPPRSGTTLKYCSRACWRPAKAKKQSARYQRARVAVSKPCIHCGKTVVRQPRWAKKLKFCSLSCAYAWRRARRAEKLAAKPCVVCGKPGSPNGKTCSAKCGYAYRKSHSRGTRQCPHCREWFTKPKSTLRSQGKYCSRPCFLAVHNLRPQMKTVACETCGGKFKRTAAALARTARHFCSTRCWSELVRGEEHQAYRGGSDPNRGSNWQKLAESIRVRDGHRCRRCNKTQEENGQKLSVDHVIPWRSFTDKALANVESNLVSLCRACHSWKSHTAERRWLKGDVLGLAQYIRSVKGELQ